MNIQCPFCHALHWTTEALLNSSIANPKFGMCCYQGKISIPPLQPAPPVMTVHFGLLFFSLPIYSPSLLLYYEHSPCASCNGLELDLSFDIKTGTRCLVDCAPTPPICYAQALGVVIVGSLSVELSGRVRVCSGRPSCHATQGQNHGIRHGYRSSGEVRQLA